MNSRMTIMGFVTGWMAICPCFLANSAHAQPSTVRWADQFGTWLFEYAFDVTADSAGSVYVTGMEYPASLKLGMNAFVRKYTRDGELVWATSLGTEKDDYANGIEVDTLGNVFVAGLTDGDFAGSSAGMEDMFIAKLNSDGEVLWKRQIGTNSLDWGLDVAVDASGNSFVAGLTDGSFGGPGLGTYDAAIAKFSPDGDLLWTRQYGGISVTMAEAVVTDSLGNAYIAGWTDGTFSSPKAPGRFAFLIKISPSGDFMWVRYAGDPIYSITCDAADIGPDDCVYIAGQAGILPGHAPSGSADAYVVKFDSDGNQIWGSLFGSAAEERCYAVSVDNAGFVYAAGFTKGDYGAPNAGDRDAFLTKLSPTGFPLWTHQAGASVDDRYYGVAADVSGRVYVCGTAWGDVFGPGAGAADAIVVCLEPTCYADCDGNGSLDFYDFLCFQSAFHAANTYADCDVNMIFDIFDYLCFQSAFMGACQ